MITTGVSGHAWRASITESGAIVPWDDDRTLNWYVAADDRWHVPSADTAVRQFRVQGTAVTETRVRVPNGDVVHRAYSVADAGGITIVEVENESTLPVAIAFDRHDLLTERTIGDVPIEGIDLPVGSFVMPLGHAATLRVGLAHHDPSPGRLPGRIPTFRQVARGWLGLTERASRFVLPDGEIGATLVERCVAERCELALGSIPDGGDDPAGFALALAELVRMGEEPGHWIPELVDAVESLGPSEGWDADMGLTAAGRVLVAADEQRARADLGKILHGRRSGLRPVEAPNGVRAVAWLEQLMADGPAVLAHGLPSAWLGQSLDVYGIPTGDATSVSYALRWHGARPAMLWEQAGAPVELSAPVVAPAWRSAERMGETLWPEPPSAPEN